MPVAPSAASPPAPGPNKPAPPSVASATLSGPLSTPTPQDPFGIVGSEVAGTFLVETAIAHGGFAVVYRAQHLRFSAPVALKCLKIPANLSPAERADFLDRFQKEGEVMFRLSSSIPEIVRPLQFDSFKLPDGRLVPFIALEWLEGITLKEVIVQRLEDGQAPLSLVQAVTFLTPVARALARAHRMPSPEGPLCILHCDLKPDNVFVTELGGAENLRIFDFGISKVRHAATRQVGGSTTDSQTNMFTPAYAAPEQWSPDRFGQTGPWTDVFSLALTVTEMVTQKAAIDGAPTAMLTQCVNDKLRPTPRRLGLAIPDRIEAIFLRALAVDPRTRYQSIPKFWGELEEALGLPAVVGETARRSQSFVGLRVDSQHDLSLGAEASRPAAAQAQASFAGELDLPLQSPALSPAPALAAAPAQDGALAFDLPGVVGAGAPVALSSPPIVSAPEPIAHAGPIASFDLADDAMQSPQSMRGAIYAGPPIAPPGHHASQGGFVDVPPSGGIVDVPSSVGLPAGGMSGASIPATSVPTPGSSGAALPVQAVSPPSAPPGGLPGTPVASGTDVSAASLATKDRLQAVASKAGQVASVAAVSAASAAKHLATRALEVDQRHRIELDQPSTWIKPMMGPIVAMVAALVISIGAVFVNKASGSNVSVVWISLPLMLAAIGFAVYRWMKITKE